MDSSRPRKKPGPAPKGNRVQVTVTVPVEVRGQVQVIADREGLAFTNIVERLLSESLGLPVPAYCLPKTTSQGELPLAEAS